MDVKECLGALGWTYTEDSEGGNYNDIACPCGGEMEFRGFFGTEVIECLQCGKHMVDLFSPITVSSGACTFLNYKDYDIERNRHWIAIDKNGGIKINP